MSSDPIDRRPVWPGGAALWLWAAPAIVTCGNFGLLLVVMFANAEWLEAVDDFWRSLGGEWLADVVIFGGLTAPAALPGVAYLLRRRGPTPAGWRDAGLYVAVVWPAATSASIGLITALRELSVW